MKISKWFFVFLLIILNITLILAGEPAARLGDKTLHGGSIVRGEPSVLIGGMPAARVGDMHTCPMVTPTVPPVPHIGGPVATGSSTVLIGGMPAARAGDMAVCSNGPPDQIMVGYATVLIGDEILTEDKPDETDADQGTVPAMTTIKSNSENRLASPQAVQAPRVLKSTASDQQVISITETPKTDEVLEMDQEQKIITSKGITIESTGSRVEILAGSSRIVMDASGKIVIESNQIELRSAGDLNLKGANVTISADAEMRLEGTKVISEASSENQVKGPQVTVEGALINTIKGGLVKIN